MAQAAGSEMSRVHARRASRPFPVALLPVAALFLTTGLSLVITILIGVSLPLSIVVCTGTGCLLAGLAVWRAPAWLRRYLRTRLWVGLLTGLAATGAYDLTRFGVASIASLSFQPFHLIEVFGQMFVGESAPQWAIVGAGIAYHVCNGTTFSIAYVLLFLRPSILSGLAWAGLLEVFMITLYPGWLNVQRVDELALVSILGHVAYGVTLGAVGRWLLDAPRRKRVRLAATSVPPPPPPGEVLV